MRLIPNLIIVLWNLIEGKCQYCVMITVCACDSYDASLMLFISTLQGWGGSEFLSFLLRQRSD